MTTVLSVLETAPKQGILLPSLGNDPFNRVIIGIVDVPISNCTFPVLELIAIGTGVTPSTLDIPRHMGILFCSLRAEKSCWLIGYRDATELVLVRGIQPR